jgi:hypothetical protein
MLDVVVYDLITNKVNGCCSNPNPLRIGWQWELPKDHNVQHDLVLKMHRCQDYWGEVEMCQRKPMVHLQHKAELLTWWVW